MPPGADRRQYVCDGVFADLQDVRIDGGDQVAAVFGGWLNDRGR
jgi:hypothetical protein